MSIQIEKSIRIQQVKLLRLEKYLLRVAPIAIAVGLSTPVAAEARGHLQKLEEAKVVFAAMAPTSNVASIIEKAETDISDGISRIQSETDRNLRLASMTRILQTIDETHMAAQEEALNSGVRLLGQKVSKRGMQAQGGTPKVSSLVKAFTAQLSKA